MSILVDTLHIFLCKTPHSYDMLDLMDRKSGLCHYYLEHDIAECDSLPDHIKWNEIAGQFKTHLNLSSDKEAFEFIKQAVRLAAELKKLVGDNTDRLEFVKEVMR
jgi:hypothetical protein